MEYSKISSVELINFMSFKKAKLSFDELGIINIKGYNDSGKSAILRGISVCLMDMFKRSQLKFIRHGEEYFRVVVTFEDGVSILRDKYINGQSLYEVYKNEELIFTTKQGNRLSKIDGVPKQIADYLGLCITDSVYLNYQSCLDKLPVVDTTGSENYQMFHEVLRMEEIYKASNMINLDKNDLGLDISTMEYELQREQILLDRCGDVSREFIDVIASLENESIITNNKKESLGKIDSIAEGCDRIKVIPKVEKVNTDRLVEVSGIDRLLSDLDGRVTLPSIKRVSVDRISNLQGIIDRVSKLETYKTIPNIPKIDESLVEKRSVLVSLEEAYDTWNSKKSFCSTLDSRLDSLRSELNTIVMDAKARGIELVKCNNCGCYTESEGGHVHEEYV